MNGLYQNLNFKLLDSVYIFNNNLIVILIMKIKSLKKYLIVPILIIIFVSCRSDSDTPTDPDPVLRTRGALLTFEKTGEFSTNIIEDFLNSLSTDQPVQLIAAYDVEVYKVIYITQNHNGEIVEASGAIFLPKGKNNFSIASIHHGTQTKRDRVGSVSPLYAPEGLAAASLGYFTLVPDYLGLGESTSVHPYHHQKSSAEPVIDFIRAGKEFAKKNNLVLNGQIFLAGYSEGGYVTLAAHKEIEQNYSAEIEVTASAPMAGAYDLNLTAKTIIQQGTYNEPSFLAYFLVAYNEIYGWNRLNDFFNSPYSERLPSLFDGTKTTSQINAQLTSNLSQLFKQSFISSYLNGTETIVTQAFNENSLLNWVPSSPIRFYHGDADEYVPYENAVIAKNYFLSHGGDVDLITIPGGTHATSVLPSIISAIEWFETIRISKLIADKK